MTNRSFLPVHPTDTTTTTTARENGHRQHHFDDEEDPGVVHDESSRLLPGARHHHPGGDGRWPKLLRRSSSSRLSNIGSTARDHLANERTYLAWIRTSLALVGASIGLLKWDVDAEGYLVGTVGMTILLTSTWRYFHVMRLLREGQYEPNVASIWVMIIVLWGAVGAAYLLHYRTTQHRIPSSLPSS